MDLKAYLSSEEFYGKLASRYNLNWDVSNYFRHSLSIGYNNYLGRFPLVLCGPIVRKTTAESVSIWIAMKEYREVGLKVYEDDEGSKGQEIAVDVESRTARLGYNLSVALVTAKPQDDKKFDAGKAYLYDLSFGNGDTLDTPGIIHNDPGTAEQEERITYPGCELPSFIIPPEKVRDLKVVHGSCRNVNGGGDDAMPILDDVLADSFNGRRPHQLLLTGDQIYADDVRYVHQHLLTDAGDLLLAGERIDAGTETYEDVWESDDTVLPKEVWAPQWREPLPLKEEGETVTTITAAGINLQTGNRGDFVREHANFTTTSNQGHLISLGEYFAMYLSVWSPVLWLRYFKLKTRMTGSDKVPPEPKDDPEIKKLKKQIREAASQAERATLQKQCEELWEKLEKERLAALMAVSAERLREFVQGLFKVRRALANIPTYMMFDDHETTDDWHVNRNWVRETYETPLGRRIMMNGLAAFAVFQAWGNIPEHFARDKPGGKLLDELERWVTHRCATPPWEEDKDTRPVKAICKLLNLPLDKAEAADLAHKLRTGDKAFTAAANTVQWYFDIQFPTHQLLATDARTFRSFPGKQYQPSVHLSDKAIEKQVPKTEENPELTLLISPCNLVTIPLFRNWLSVYLLPFFQYFTKFKRGDRHKLTAFDPDLADSWEVHSPAFEKMLARLASRVPEKDGKRHAKVVAVSGDVHFSFAARLQYWAEKPLGGNAAEHRLTMAHLTASAFKNEVGMFAVMHDIGYELANFISAEKKLPEPEIILGYPKPDSFSEEKAKEILLNTRWFPNYYPAMMQETPAMLPLPQMEEDLKVPKPDWFYRIDFVRGAKGSDYQADLPDPDPDPNPDQKWYHKVGSKLKKHYLYGKNSVAGRDIISRNSLAVLNFHWEGKGKVSGEALSKTAKTLKVDVEEVFPDPPFQIVIGEELMDVSKVETQGDFIHLTIAKRGDEGTTAAEHRLGAEVKIRQAVRQTHWLLEKELTEAEINLKPVEFLTYRVPLEDADPAYPKPELPLEENAVTP
ncbi:MAG: hypothetical protein KDD10_09760 [Phaeodactylibacter sp.]|nr:hypothetical protein [Phaeodactylibacter sp.]